MTNVQLRYIVSVDNYKNFALAAEKCFVTQPTLSMQIQKLEEELGVLIFDRSKQPVKATHLGNKIIEQARVVLNETNRIQDLISEETNEFTGIFTLGIIPTIGPNLLPLFIEKFVKKYPDLDLVIEELQTDQIIEKLRTDELDAGILMTPLRQKEIVEEPMFYEPFVGYVSRKHRLWKSKKINSSDLSKKDLFLLKEGHCFRDNVLQICDRYGKDVNGEESKFGFEGGSLETLRKMVENNFGMTLMPLLSLKDLKNTDKVKHIRKFNEPIPYREISMVTRRVPLKKKIREALKTEIIEVIPKKYHSHPEGFIVG